MTSRKNGRIAAIGLVAYRLLSVEASGPRPGGLQGAADTTRRAAGTRVSRALARRAACRIRRHRDLRWKRAPIPTYTPSKPNNPTSARPYGEGAAPPADV